MKNLDIHPSVKAIRATQPGIGISIILVIVESISGHIGHSYALIADVSETGADIFNVWVFLEN